MPSLSALHYFELDMGEAADELRPALFAAIHGFNTKNENALGLDFSGMKMRVFGEEGPLTSFFTQPRILRMLALAAGCRPPAPVPACDKAVYVGRDSRGMSPARLRRFMARNPDAPRPSVHVPRADLAVSVRSQSNGRTFLLKLVRRDAPMTPFLQFSSYGTCAGGSSVPLF